MQIEESSKIDKKYSGGLTNLLLYFLGDTNLPEEEWNDLNTIKKYVGLFDKETLDKTIMHGREILALQDFPVDWVGDTSNRFPFKMSNEATAQDYYDWVKWMVDTLEVEAKKAGKL